MNPTSLEHARQEARPASSALELHELAAGQEAEWDAFVASIPEGTHYHRAGWAKVIRNAFGQKPHYRLVRRNGEIEGILPLVAFANPSANAVLDTSFYGVGVGFITDDDGPPTIIPGAATVIEGGSVDGNGAGTVLTTESCLLNPNRGSGRGREAMERRLSTWLGATNVLWLGEGIDGDDTDGHVDDLARFVDPGTVVVAVEPRETDANFAPLAENLSRVRRMRDQHGKPLSAVPLPMPPVLEIDGTEDVGGGRMIPSTSADQFAATLARWFGIPETDLDIVAPNLPNFIQRDLGFML